MRQFKSGFSFVMPDETGFFYSLIILYTILGQNSNFWNREVYENFSFVRKIRKFCFVRKMFQGRPLYHTKVLKFPKTTPAHGLHLSQTNPAHGLHLSQTNPAHSSTTAPQVTEKISKKIFYFFWKTLDKIKSRVYNVDTKRKEVNKNEKIHRQNDKGKYAW